MAVGVLHGAGNRQTAPGGCAVRNNDSVKCGFAVGHWIVEVTVV